MSSEPICASCGKPRDNHPYRHPFVGVVPPSESTGGEPQGFVMVDDGERVSEAFKAVETALSGMTPDGQERVLRACMILRGLK